MIEAVHISISLISISLNLFKDNECFTFFSNKSRNTTIFQYDQRQQISYNQISNRKFKTIN